MLFQFFSEKLTPALSIFFFKISAQSSDDGRSTKILLENRLTNARKGLKNVRNGLKTWIKIPRAIWASNNKRLDAFFRKVALKLKKKLRFQSSRRFVFVSSSSARHGVYFVDKNDRRTIFRWIRASVGEDFANALFWFALKNMEFWMDFRFLYQIRR